MADARRIRVKKKDPTPPEAGTPPQTKVIGIDPGKTALVVDYAESESRSAFFLRPGTFVTDGGRAAAATEPPAGYAQLDGDAHPSINPFGSIRLAETMAAISAVGVSANDAAAQLQRFRASFPALTDTMGSLRATLLESAGTHADDAPLTDTARRNRLHGAGFSFRMSTEYFMMDSSYATRLDIYRDGQNVCSAECRTSEERVRGGLAEVQGAREQVAVTLARSIADYFRRVLLDELSDSAHPALGGPRNSRY